MEINNKGRRGRRNNSDKNRNRRNDSFKITSKIKYVDTHCHVEYVLQKKKLFGFGKLKKSFPSNYEACISIFCDPAAFSSFGMYQELLKEESIYGAFRIHPHNAKYWNENLEKRLLNCLKVFLFLVFL